MQIRLRAERKAGELLRDRGKPQGRRTDLVGSHDQVDGRKTLAELGISYDQSSQWQKLAAVPKDDFEAELAGPEIPTTAGEYHENEIRKDFTVSERVAILKTIERHEHGGDRKSDQRQKIAVDRGKAAKLAGFGNRETARQATRVVDKGTPELVAARPA